MQPNPSHPAPSHLSRLVHPAPHPLLPAAGQNTPTDLDTGLSLQGFIAEVFWQHHGARVASFCDTLVGIPQATSQGHSGRTGAAYANQGPTQATQHWLAAAGYNLAEDGPLFLEQYLNEASLEAHLEKHLQLHVQRHQVAEVGNLAALQAGGARALIVHMTHTLHHLGRRWVVFTATQSLINSFGRMGLEPLVLMPALPSKVSKPQAWGRYYDHKPCVVLGDITKGYKALTQQKEQAQQPGHTKPTRP